jgi:ParB/RepB/Spo0J family partition protein
VTIAQDITWLSVDSLWVERDARQRSKVDTKGLVESVRDRGILHPLIVRPASGPAEGQCWLLVAGERRWTAARELGHQLVPCRQWGDLSPVEARIVELEENIKREDLDWRDLVRGVEDIHISYGVMNRGQTMEQTGEAMGIHKSTISQMLRVARSISDPAIKDCDSYKSAYNTLTRRDERQAAAQEQSISDLLDAPVPQGLSGSAAIAAAAQVQDAKMAEHRGPAVGPKLAIPAARSILHESFLQWAPRYDGPKFNLIHCDFPYGIGVFAGPQMAASGHQYADDEDTYFRLLRCLCANMDRLCAHKAHLMFWYSEKHGQVTRQLFRELAPDWLFQPFPLIWVKSDNSGIAADSRQSPRHVYETCAMATRGARPIVRIVGDAYSAPSDRRLHVSAKPVPVLSHFMTMLVDEHTTLLDPTCGSGNALQAAERLGARYTLGLEIDEQQVGIARAELGKFRTLRGMESL